MTPNLRNNIPVQIIMVIISLAFGEHHSEVSQAIANITIIALFYLLRPDKNTGTTSNGAAFHLCNLQLWIGNQAIDVIHTPEAQLFTGTSASLVFTTQKNGVRGEVVNHACSGATYCCPSMTLVRQVTHLHQHNIASTTLIATYYEANRQRPFTPNDITIILRHVVHLIGMEVGLVKADVSAHLLRAGGGWCSFVPKSTTTPSTSLDNGHPTPCSVTYLQVHPVMRNFATQILQHGMYDLVKNVQQQSPQAD
jgi:hypothetical protein